MDSSFNIVSFIESNPVAKLSSTYNNRLLSKVKENFNETQQQMFISSFYCYLNYHPTNDFVIDLDDVWKWLGFNQKYNAKRTLDKHFLVDKDYKILLIQMEEQDRTKHGGHNKDTIMLNIKTFKLFCIKAGTEKANEIHEYFVKLEELLHETIHEECIELKQQLENQVLVSQNQQDILREKTILKQFPANTQCVYYGKIDNQSVDGEPLIKFGCSNFLCDRVKAHHKTYDNFSLIHAFKVDNCQQIENAMKYHPVLNQLRRSIKINDVRFTELIALNGLSYENFDIIIKDIIKKIEYSPENYTALLNENEKNQKKIHVLMLENEHLTKKINMLCGVKPNTLSPSNETHPPGEPTSHNITTFKQIRKFNKSKDGKYRINGLIYDKLFGTRQEVWDNIAYKTTGDLIKDDLTISQSVNNCGKIISKAKCITEKSRDSSRFTPC
jgi:phage anti-repressor protein